MNFRMICFAFKTDLKKRFLHNFFVCVLKGLPGSRGLPGIAGGMGIGVAGPKGEPGM